MKRTERSWLILDDILISFCKSKAGALGNKSIVFKILSRVDYIMIYKFIKYIR